MDYEIELKDDNDEVRLKVPGGHVIVIQLSDIDDDALPELAITLPVPMVANCWSEGTIPAEPVGADAPNALLCTMIDIPIEGSRKVLHGG